jgi:hypothetical protein
MALSEENRLAARAVRIAVFEDRLILDAQPPIDAATLAKIEKRCAGPIPEGLKALWAVSFGGRLDYDFRVDFRRDIAALSFDELFYPKSGGHRDLWGWIAYQQEMSQKHEARASSVRVTHLPFGGSRLMECLYVCVQPGADYGKVTAWREYGHPTREGKFRPFISTAANDIPSLFRKLVLDTDPFAFGGKDVRRGATMVRAIERLDQSDPQAAAALTGMIEKAVQDAPAIAAKFSELLAARAARDVAVEAAVIDGDLALVKQLAAEGADVEGPRAGGGNLLDRALANGRLDIADWLLGCGVDVKSALISGASHATVEITRQLLNRGANFSAQAIVDATSAGLKDSARLIVDAAADYDLGTLDELFACLDHSAEEHETAADRLEEGEMVSPFTVERHRQKAADLRTIQAYSVRLTARRKR